LASDRRRSHRRTPAKKGEQRGWDRQAHHEAECGGGGSDKSQLTVANGNHAIPGKVTGPGSPVMRPKTLPSSQCDSGKAPREPEPPLKRRVKTHTANAQGSSTPVPWRWRSRAARIRGCDRHARASRTTQRAEVRHTAARSAVPPTSFGHIDRCTWEVSSRFDALVYTCHHRLVNGYVCAKGRSKEFNPCGLRSEISRRRGGVRRGKGAQSPWPGALTVTVLTPGTRID
jgi:hypothetical protein